MAVSSDRPESDGDELLPPWSHECDGGPVIEACAGAFVKFLGHLPEPLVGEEAEIGAPREVLTKQPVDASMSSRVLALGDLVCPCRMVGVHGSVDDVDQVWLEDTTSTACAPWPTRGGPGVVGRRGSIVSARWRRCRKTLLSRRLPPRGGGVPCLRSRRGSGRSRCSGRLWRSWRSG